MPLPLSILFFSPQPLWPTNTGSRLRNFHLARALSADCNVSILQIRGPGQSVEAPPPSSFQRILSAERDRSYTPSKLIRGLAGPTPLTVLNYTSSNVARVLLDTLKTAPFDAVQMESIHLFQYLETVQKLNHPPAVVLDWHNIESELMRRYAAGTANPAKRLIASRTARLLENLENQALRTCAAHTVVSERERAKLLARYSAAPISVIANGVDTAAFAGSPVPKASYRRTLLFVGSMDYHANSDAVLWFCRAIWPKAAAEFPQLDFKIVGRNPPDSVKALAGPRITVTGTVDDVRPFYHEAIAVVVPLRVGGGTRLKILEAMAAGVPVISTNVGAEGIEARHRREILLADSPEGITAEIRVLLTQPELASRLCAAALSLVTQNYDWAVLGQKLAHLYASIRE